MEGHFESFGTELVPLVAALQSLNRLMLSCRMWYSNADLDITFNQLKDIVAFGKQLNVIKLLHVKKIRIDEKSYAELLDIRKKGNGKEALSISIPDINKAWQHDMFEPYEASFRADERQSQRSENHRSAQINLSNLEQKVSKEDLYDLFSLIGNLQDVRLACDRYGRSEGTAIIVFERKVDAVEAMHRYNGCRLDNKILKMELTHSSSETSVPVCYKNNISNDIQTNNVASRSHLMDVQNVVDCFKSLQIQVEIPVHKCKVMRALNQC
ncbi:hypothetical protein HA402_014074 [Bradysia odoriphaga]|nr:hypothetical protein HA402_014074 [Bradysia odoriphaga]